MRLKNESLSKIRSLSLASCTALLVANLIVPSAQAAAETLKEWMRLNKTNDTDIVLKQVILQERPLAGENLQNSQRLIWKFLTQKIDEKWRSHQKNDSLARYLNWKIKMVLMPHFDMPPLTEAELSEVAEMASALAQVSAISEGERANLHKSIVGLEQKIESLREEQRQPLAGPAASSPVAVGDMSAETALGQPSAAPVSDDEPLVTSRKKAKGRIIDDESDDEGAQGAVMTLPPSGAAGIDSRSPDAALPQPSMPRKRTMARRTPGQNPNSVLDRIQQNLMNQRLNRGRLEEQEQLKAALSASRQEYDALHEADEASEAPVPMGAAAVSPKAQPKKRKAQREPEPSSDVSSDEFSLNLSSDEDSERDDPVLDEGSSDEDTGSDYSLDIDDSEPTFARDRKEYSIITAEDGARIEELFNAQRPKNIAQLTRDMGEKYSRATITAYLEKRGLHKPVKKSSYTKWSRTEKRMLKKAFKEERPQNITAFSRKMAEKLKRTPLTIAQYIADHRKKNRALSRPVRTNVAQKRWAPDEKARLKRLIDIEIQRSGGISNKKEFLASVQDQFPDRGYNSFKKQVSNIIDAQKVKDPWSPDEEKKLEGLIEDEIKQNGPHFIKAQFARDHIHAFKSRTEKGLVKKIKRYLKKRNNPNAAQPGADTEDTSSPASETEE